MFQSNQITTARALSLNKRIAPETAQFFASKILSRQALILSRRKVFEASAPGYLTIEYCKTPGRATRVSWAKHSHWVRICKLPNGPAAVVARTKGLASLRKTAIRHHLVSQKTLFLRLSLLNFVLSSPKPSILVSQKTPFLRFLGKPCPRNSNPPSPGVFCFLASCFLLLASCFLLLASHFLLLASCFLLLASCFLLPTSCFLLPTSCFLLPTSCFLLLASCFYCLLAPPLATLVLP